MQRNASVDRRRLMAPAIAAALFVLAVGLLLSGGRTGQAADDPETQGIAADITSTISWNPTGCDFSTTILPQNFSVAAGDSETSPIPSVGCVSSNEAWDVSALMTANPAVGGEDIPSSAFRIQRLDPTATVNEVIDILDPDDTLGLDSVAVNPLLASGSSCTGTTCNLNTSQLIVNNAPANGLSLPVGGINLLGGVFAWQYTLTAPADQPAGSYIGGQVTLTASN